jgi:arylsulfatase B|eukprot:COSAG06_NODE_15674_length_1054_cov_0.524607_1_plen_195_part_00
MVGKWHVGLSYWEETPVGRGFDTYMGFFEGSMDHWTQAYNTCAAGECPAQITFPNPTMAAAGLSGNYIDWWCTDKPCWGKNGTEFVMGENGQVVGRDHDYTDWQATQECIRIVKEHDVDIPLFFYVAFQVNHTPLEVPDCYIERYPATWREDRRWYAGMATYWDEAMGNITATYKARGMWDNTLVVVSSCLHLK